MIQKCKKAVVLVVMTITFFSGILNVSAEGIKDVFNAKYYAEANADLKPVFGYDEKALFNHYITYGLSEGRCGSMTFNVVEYRKANPDLEALFGDNWDAYVNHYFAFGKAEGRPAGVSDTAGTTAAVGSTGTSEKQQAEPVSVNEVKKPVVSGKYLTVAQDGSGDFLTIQAAVDAAPNNGKIVVLPGTYNENVRVIGKAVNIIGSDKDECVLTYDTGSYFYVPLEIAAGSVSNITIYGYHSGNGMSSDKIDYAIDYYGDESYDRLKDVPGYAVHIEQDYLYGKSLTFTNCCIISENNQCVGIGSRGKSTLTFKNCEFINSNCAGCIAIHDSVEEQFGGKSTFVMENCTMESSCEYVMALFTYNPYNSFDMKFINVTAVDNNGLLSVPVMTDNYAGTNDGWAGLCNARLLPGSTGNNIDIMNYE